MKTSQTLSSTGMSSVLGSLSSKGKKSQAKEKMGSHKRAAEEKSEFEKYKVKAPRYDLGQVLPKDNGVEVPKFVNPSKDPSLNRAAIPLHDVNGLKVKLKSQILISIVAMKYWDVFCGFEKKRSRGIYKNFYVVIVISSS